MEKGSRDVGEVAEVASADEANDNIGLRPHHVEDPASCLPGRLCGDRMFGQGGDEGHQGLRWRRESEPAAATTAVIDLTPRR